MELKRVNVTYLLAKNESNEHSGKFVTFIFFSAYLFHYYSHFHVRLSIIKITKHIIRFICLYFEMDLLILTEMLM